MIQSQTLASRCSRTFLRHFTLALTTLCFGSSLVHGADTWMPFFNGRDLSGWRANMHPDSWSVKDGAIKAHATKQYSHLFFVDESPRGEFSRFKNFVLELEVRTEPRANGGIYFHTDFTTKGDRNSLAKGYELQINSSEHEKRKTGSLYGVVDLAESPVDPTRWFKVRLTVNGKRIATEIDGKVVVDYTEPVDVQGDRKLSPTGGAVALQAHDPSSVVYYRDIRIRRLEPPR